MKSLSNYGVIVQLSLDLVAEKMLNLSDYDIQESFNKMGVID